MYYNMMGEKGSVPTNSNKPTQTLKRSKVSYAFRVETSHFLESLL